MSERATTPQAVHPAHGAAGADSAGDGPAGPAPTALLEELTADCTGFRERMREAEGSLGRLRTSGSDLAGERLAVAMLTFQQFAAERLTALTAAPAEQSPAPAAAPARHAG